LSTAALTPLWHKIAGHANTKITGEYSIVQLKRQDDLNAPDSRPARESREEGQ
jgi:hypothetical protein